MPVLADINEGVNFIRKVDIIDAAFVESQEKVVFVDHVGSVGWLELEDGGVTARIITRADSEDFTVVSDFKDGKVLIGSAQGTIFSLENEILKKVAQVSEFNEPIMDIRLCEKEVWVAGSRGLLAKSLDGVHFNNIRIDYIEQGELMLPTEPSENVYLGVNNIEPDSVKIKAFVNGVAVVEDDHYSIQYDEGLMALQAELDPIPAPVISFSFQPGPPFLGGDVTWNSILCGANNIILAGEFGLILQSNDSGHSWQRRAGEITTIEPDQNYWLEGDIFENKVVLVGAAGAVIESHDAGKTWIKLELPAKDGIFGVKYLSSSELAISGAVGTVGVYDGIAWSLVDRSRLNLFSWLKNFVSIAENNWLLLGGRSTVLQYKNNTWDRLDVHVVEDSSDR